MKDIFLLPCTIQRGGFDTERIFEVVLPNGDKLAGSAFVDHLRDAKKNTLDEDTPVFGESIAGFVRCEVIRRKDSEVLIEVPSADVIQVSADQLVPSQ